MTLDFKAESDTKQPTKRRLRPTLWLPIGREV
jgi:hypothetical protein